MINILYWPWFLEWDCHSLPWEHLHSLQGNLGIRNDLSLIKKTETQRKNVPHLLISYNPIEVTHLKIPMILNPIEFNPIESQWFNLPNYWRFYMMTDCNPSTSYSELVCSLLCYTLWLQNTFQKGVTKDQQHLQNTQGADYFKRGLCREVIIIIIIIRQLFK